MKEKRHITKIVFEYEFYIDDPRRVVVYKAFEEFMKVVDTLEPIRKEEKKDKK